jgi:hypothetical protein
MTVLLEPVVRKDDSSVCKDERTRENFAALAGK